jgi:hypothetical protein
VQERARLRSVMTGSPKPGPSEARFGPRLLSFPTVPALARARQPTRLAPTFPRAEATLQHNAATRPSPSRAPQRHLAPSRLDHASSPTVRPRIGRPASWQILDRARSDCTRRRPSHASTTRWKPLTIAALGNRNHKPRNARRHASTQRVHWRVPPHRLHPTSFNPASAQSRNAQLTSEHAARTTPRSSAFPLEC